MQLPRRLFAALTLLLTAPLALPGAFSAFAQVPKPWEMGMQPAGSILKERIIDLHNLVLVIITLITIFVGVLMLWVMWRYSAKRNPNPSQTAHHTLLEIAWTVIPVLILVVIAIPSFRLLYFLDHTPDPDMTIKVTAHQASSGTVCLTGGWNSSTKPSARAITAAKATDRARCGCASHRSAQRPSKGSMKASASLVISSTAPKAARGRP